MSNVKVNFNMVGDFHRKFDLPVLDRELSKPTILDDHTFLYRFDLILEETSEVFDAHTEGDLYAFADGLGDLLYVLLGFGHYSGFEPVVDVPLNSNQASPGQLADPSFVLHSTALTRHVSGILRAHRKRDTHKIYGETCSAIFTVYQMAFECCIPMDRVFAEIQRANMTKVRSTGDGDSRSTRGSGMDVVKPAGFVPPRIAEVLRGTV